MSGYDQAAWENEVWAFVFATVDSTITFGGKPPASGVQRLLARAKALAKHKFGFALVANPLFVLNGVCDADDDSNPATAAYLRGRLGKTGASLAQGITTSSLKAFTVVDPLSMARSGVAIGSTIAHIAHLKAIAAKWRNSTTITRWLDTLLFFKYAKIGKQSISLASAALPYAPPGTDTALQLAGDALTGAGVGASAGGIAAAAMLPVRRVAIELHWRAYREQVLGRAGGAVGPASAILTELFTKQTASRLLGAHETDALIKEAAGWMAIEDKISLL